MTATVITCTGRTMFFNNIVKMDRIGTHTYEFTQFINREHSRIRVVDVSCITMSDMCQCHNHEYKIDVPSEYRNTTT